MLLLPALPIAFRVYVFLLRFTGVIPLIRKVSRDPERILVVNLTRHIGDIVMSLPLLERLHKERPQAILEVAVAAPMGSFLLDVPFIVRVHELDFGAARPPMLHLYRRIWKMVRYAVKSLSNTSYDICLLPRWGNDPNGSAYLAYLTDASLRYGQDPREEQNVRETFWGTRYLMTSALRGGHGLPEAIRELRLLPWAGLVDAFDEGSAEKQPIETLQMLALQAASPELWERLSLSPAERFMVIAPGAHASHRRWPLENFVECARALREIYGFSIVALGSAGERSLGVELEQLSSGIVRSLIGKTNLTETIAVFANAQLFIGNDSGPAHIAGGLGVPSLILSTISINSRAEGPSSPLRVRPVGPWVSIVQPARGMDGCTDHCTRDTPHCIVQISPADVVERAQKLLNRSRL